MGEGRQADGAEGLPDSYCKVYLEGDKEDVDLETKRKTVVVKKCLDPVWDASFS